MADIFGVDENDWCDALKDMLKRLEQKRKDKKKPGEFIEVRHKYELLGIGITAWLDGERELGEPEIINLKIGGIR